MENQDRPAPRWSRAQLLAFRFAFVYLILYYLPFPLGALPRTGRVAQKYESLWHTLVPWVGRHILHLSYEISTAGNCSGDTTYEYVRVLCFLALAFVASLLWSFVDRSSSSYQRTHEWLRLYVRLSVGAAMLMYAAAKIFLQHFPPPNLYKLLEPLGDYSQMSLLWTFMGASRGYTIFAGCLQLFAGMFLFVPRLTTLGALVGVAVFSNIFALNLGYDLPVKLYSLHILLVFCFLLLPDARRLVNFLLLNRAVPSAPETALFDRRRLNAGALVAQFALGAVLFCSYFYRAHDFEKRTFGVASRPPLYGIWNVEEFVLGGKVLPPLAADENRWHKVVFQFPREVSIQSMNGSWTRYWLREDIARQALALGKANDSKEEFAFAFANPDSRSLTLVGSDGSNNVRVKLRRVDETQFAVLARGLHWIDEDINLVQDEEGVCDRVRQTPGPLLVR
ncbi:MAG TPA: hypothetical protein VE778_01685 [Candidatus Bathyarchaeia archaeon]|nr:hypothetical protein [Candidatus Bathyarchaeia archaeon]